MRLNEQAIRKIEAPTQGYRLIRDGEIPGFGLRVTANDARAFTLTYTTDGRQRRLTIGAWPVWTATAARERAKELRRLIDRGEDPLGEKESRREAPTFRQIADEYMEKHAAGKKSGHGDREYLERDVLPQWGSRKAADITRRDVIALIEAKAATAPVAANRLLACVRKLFNWSIERDLLGANPCVQVKAPVRETRRDRVLTEPEISLLWERLTTPARGKGEVRLTAGVNAAIRLILVTAQRPGECCQLEWSELDQAGWWSIPAQKAKNGLAHRVPMTKLALEQLPERGASRWVFPSPRGDKPIQVNALSHATRLNLAALGLSNFHPHDLRRTAASLMTGSGIPRLTVKRILNHAESDVTAIYDRYSYDSEKRLALERWERELRRIVGAAPKTARVIKVG
jgi:integrase